MLRVGRVFFYENISVPGKPGRLNTGDGGGQVEGRSARLSKQSEIL